MKLTQSRAILLVFGFTLIFSTGIAIEKSYRCQAKNNSQQNKTKSLILDDWKLYGNLGNWKCVGGSLQSEATLHGTGIRYTGGIFRDGVFSFDIKSTIGDESVGRGETVVWLRNGAVDKKMRRIRLVIEEQPNHSSVMRIEELMELGGYKRLSFAYTKSYLGHYEVALKDKAIEVNKEKISLKATTSVVNSGSLYLHNSLGEGRLSAYGELIVNSEEFPR